MSAGKYVILYLVTLAVFLVLDFIWLGLVARNFYRSQLGDLMRKKPVWSVAFGFYALFILGLLIFVLTPAIKSGSWTTALLTGGLFGLFTYATYDLTNLATLRNWPLPMVVVDLVWGVVLSGAVSLISFLVYDRLLSGGSPG